MATLYSFSIDGMETWQHQHVLLSIVLDSTRSTILIACIMMSDTKSAHSALFHWHEPVSWPHGINNIRLAYSIRKGRTFRDHFTSLRHSIGWKLFKMLWQMQLFTGKIQRLNTKLQYFASRDQSWVDYQHLLEFKGTLAKMKHLTNNAFVVIMPTHVLQQWYSRVNNKICRFDYWRNLLQITYCHIIHVISM